MKYVAKPVITIANKIVGVHNQQSENNPAIMQTVISLDNEEQIALTPGQEATHAAQVDDYFIKLSDKDQYIVPAAVFNAKYREYHEKSLNFGQAIEALKAGKKVERAGWNGKGMFLFLVNGSTFKVNRAPLLGIYPEGTEIEYHAHIDMKTAQGYVVPWLASQSDMLSEDWQIVE